ncbi:MAG: hypothetical protein WCT16_03505 [Candidatus Buchananbacteria bacterium]
MLVITKSVFNKVDNFGGSPNNERERIMSAENLLPTREEIIKWLLSTIQHSCHVEYFLEKLTLGNFDPERPHDLTGVGNKFDWDIIKCFALQYRNPKVDFTTYILPALNLHRKQYHHRKWNDPNPEDTAKQALDASDEDMLVGAIDACCSLLENRGYQGGMHDYDGVIEVALSNPPHKTPWMLDVIPRMRVIPRPEIELIQSLVVIPNIGINTRTFNAITSRTQEVVTQLKELGIVVR